MKTKRDKDELFERLVLMVDVFAHCIEYERLPTHGSPCHLMARRAVDESGIAPKRKRRKLPKKAPTLGELKTR